MSLAEDSLYVCLTDVDELEIIAKSKLEPECIPKEAMREVVQWAIDYFYQSGMRRAPSREALLAEWGKQIDDARVVLLKEDEEHDNAQWAIEQLKGQYTDWQFNEKWRQAVLAMSNAPPAKKRIVLEDVISDLSVLALSVRDQTNEREGANGFIESIARYDKRAAENTKFMGMTFGIPEIDQHTFGIHDGEIAVIGAPSKFGKSLFTGHVLLNEWDQKRKTVLVTMENSVDMTYDRLICLKLGIDPERWEEGKLTEAEYKLITDYRDTKLDDMKDYIVVVMPDPRNRTPIDIVRYAKSHQADSLIIDQLTFMEPSMDRLNGHQAIKHMLHELKGEISYGTTKLPCLLIHQFTREAVKELKKNPVIQPYHYSEGSEVEKTADWAFGMYASEDQQAAGLMSFQTIFARRRKSKSWEMVWRPFSGNVRVRRELTDEEMRGELR